MPSDRSPGATGTRRDGVVPPLDPPTPESLRLENPAETERDVTDFIRQVVGDAGADGVVVTLSGGIHSTVTATLAVEALGPGNVFGLVLPDGVKGDRDPADPRVVAEELVIDYRVLDVTPTLDGLLQRLPSGSRAFDGEERTKAAVGTLAARLRMAVASFEATATDRSVLGTGTRTELLLGSVRTLGDGIDALPIGHLYETQVRQLARHLDVRESIVETPPAASRWVGQTDASELGLPTETIDVIAFELFERDRSVETVASALDLPVEVVGRVDRMARDAADRRTLPSTPSNPSIADR